MRNAHFFALSLSHTLTLFPLFFTTSSLVNQVNICMCVILFYRIRNSSVWSLLQEIFRIHCGTFQWNPISIEWMESEKKHWTVYRWCSKILGFIFSHNSFVYSSIAQQHQVFLCRTQHIKCVLCVNLAEILWMWTYYSLWCCIATYIHTLEQIVWRKANQRYKNVKK